MARRINDYPDLQSQARDRRPRIALILGSGLSDVADRLTDVIELPFALIPGMDAPSVPGHRGALLLGTWARVPVLVFAGRLHFYEGHSWHKVVQPVRIAHELGASILIATNAAGGIRADLQPGALMAIRGHLDCTRGFSAACGVAVTPATPQAAYCARLLDLIELPRGIYAQMTGPSYETPAEVLALRTCGVDAVGMSTAREIETARTFGMECAAISCITNKAAGLGGGAIHHQEVLETGRRIKDKLVCLLETFIKRIDELSPVASSVI